MIVQAVTSSGHQLHRAARWWLGGWWAVVFHIVSFHTTMIAQITIGITLVVGIALIPAGLLGVPLVALSLIMAPLWTRTHLFLVEVFLREQIEEPAEPTTLTWWRRLFWSRSPWLGLAHLSISGFWSPVSTCIVTAWAAAGVAGVVAPLWARNLAETVSFARPVHFMLTTGVVSLIIVGVFLLLLLPFLGRMFAQVDLQLGRWLLGADPKEKLQQLTSQVENLTETRAKTVDSVEAERRRIERDLHDGPQQRLVSVAMDISMARDCIDDDPAMAKDILADAHKSSKEAISEMRQVARGIAPPILTDRGLDAALSALAERSVVPVTVQLELPERLNSTVESILYFCVSEALTNVAKHAAANQVTVAVSRIPGDSTALIQAVVTDDGRGGVDATRGTGITGLRQRVAALDGSLAVHSPSGGPTQITITLPDLPRGGTP